MKRIGSLCLVLLVGAALGWWGRGAPAGAAGKGRGAGVETCAAKNGDVNADGNVDLSDAVTILGHLFLGNPTELAPLCAPAPSTTALPDTGQKLCYDCDGNQVPCKLCLGQPRPCEGFLEPFLSLQDSMQRTGCANDANRFTVNGDGTVTDHCTGLMWQQETADVNGDGLPTGGGDETNWCGALDYCSRLIFAGHNDWRLPNVRELQSIVDYGRASPSIDPVFDSFPSLYWSSTSFADDPRFAWFVYFGDDIFNVRRHDVKDVSYYVRAVRSGP